MRRAAATSSECPLNQKIVVCTTRVNQDFLEDSGHRSVPVDGATNALWLVDSFNQGGSELRSTLPLGVSGSVSEITQTRWNHVFRQRIQRPGAGPVAGAPRYRRSGSRRTERSRVSHARIAALRTSGEPRCRPISSISIRAANLYPVVDPAQVFHRAVRQPAPDHPCDTAP
jgi:hypothetical protein